MSRPECDIKIINQVEMQGGESRMDHIYDHRRHEFDLTMVPGLSFCRGEYELGSSYVLPEQMAIPFYHALVNDPFNCKFSTGTLPITALTHLIVAANKLLSQRFPGIDTNLNRRTDIRSGLGKDNLRSDFIKLVQSVNAIPISDPAHDVAQIYQKRSDLAGLIRCCNHSLSKFKLCLAAAKSYREKPASKICSLGRSSAAPKYDMRKMADCDALIEAVNGHISSIETDIQNREKKQKQLGAQLNAMEQGKPSWRAQIAKAFEARNEMWALMQETISMLDSANVVVVSSLLQLPQKHSYDF